jgi:Na+-transporting NADH:ubiquinone oxidoreductase subunit NqrC
MRTFPKSLAKFREIVNERGKRLRTLPIEELNRLAGSIEQLTVDSRPATIGVIVLPLSTGGIQVVVQGFMKTKLIGNNVALDGFYKYADGSLATMAEDEFLQFD